MLVPLTMEFQNDKNCQNNLHQYLLGRDLMVGIYNKQLYFPQGEWKDYWTGEVIEGQQSKEITWPADRGGALYVRSGGIIPFGPLMQYRGEKPMNEITLYVFPDRKGSSFNYYEDDGITFDHLSGKFSITEISAGLLTDGSALIEIKPASGDFKGKVNSRSWNIIMNCNRNPLSVWSNKRQLPAEKYSYDKNRNELTIGTLEGTSVVEVKY